MRTIILATGNEGKVREVRQILANLDVNVLSMRDAGISVEAEENGSTFEENALIKAKAAAAFTDEIVLADDSGLEVDYLDGEPGIYSARYAGKETPYSVKNQMILDRLFRVPEEKRTARFCCAMAAVLPDGRILKSFGVMEGRIAYEAAGKGGFGYDPIFYVPECGCTSAELTPAEKNRLSHRAKALASMKEKLAAELLKPEEKRQEKEKRILIVSDTHRKNNNLVKVLNDTGRIDLLIHLGDAEGSEDYIEAIADCPVEILAGNSDFFTDLDREKEIQIGKYKVFLTHGQDYNVSFDLSDIQEEARSRGADIVMFGHTHRPVIESDGCLTVLNPGSLSYPRQEGRRPSYIIMDIDKNGAAHYAIHYLQAF